MHWCVYPSSTQSLQINQQTQRNSKRKSAQTNTVQSSAVKTVGVTGKTDIKMVTRKTGSKSAFIVPTPKRTPKHK